MTDQAHQVMRQHAEQQFAEELSELAKADLRPRPENWALSPWAVVRYLMGGKLDNGFVLSAKYIGNPRLMEIAVATLDPGTALFVQRQGRLVAAVELISPRNKVRPVARAAYLARHLSYLLEAVHLLLIDLHRRPLSFSFADQIAHMDDGRIINVEENRKNEALTNGFAQVSAMLPPADLGASSYLTIGD